MGVFSNQIDKEQLKPGDHIYSWRQAYLYAHHGIYIGDGKVIHFTQGAGQEVGTGTILDRVIFSSSPSHSSDNPCLSCGDQTRLGGVICSCLDCFLWGGKLYRFEYAVNPAFFIAKVRGGTCTLAASDPQEVVLHRATYLLKNGFGVYDLFKNNCEDFAIYCKTGLLVFTSIGVGRSGQLSSFMAAANAIMSSPLRFLTTSFTGLTAVGSGMYCISRLVSDIGVRRDVTKVPVENLVERLVTPCPVVVSEASTETVKKEASTETAKKEVTSEASTDTAKKEVTSEASTETVKKEASTETAKKEVTSEASTETVKKEVISKISTEIVKAN